MIAQGKFGSPRPNGERGLWGVEGEGHSLHREDCPCPPLIRDVFGLSCKTAPRIAAVQVPLKTWLTLTFCLLCTLTCSSSVLFALSVQKSPSEAQLHAEKGIQATRAGDLPTAEEELREAVRLAPNDPLLLSTLGSILGMQQKLQEAISYFEQAVKIDPSNTELRRHLAATQWQLGRFLEARKNLEYILRIDPNDKQALLLAGMVAENLKDYPAASGLLSKVPELVDQRPEAQLALGRSYYKLGQQEDARKILGKISSRVAGAKFVFWAGQEAFSAQDYDTAEALFLSIQPLYADQASAWLRHRSDTISDPSLCSSSENIE